MIVPFVRTPSCEYIFPLGFFFTPRSSNWNVHFSSGCVTLALVKRRPVGRMKRSYFGAFLVKPCPTKVAFVIIRFQELCFLFPDLKTLNISSSAIGRTFGRGTSHFPAFSLRFCLTVLLSTLALAVCSRSSRYAGMAPSATGSSALCLFSLSLCCAMVFFMAAFSANLFLANILPLIPINFCAIFDVFFTERASFFLVLSS
mmetsp:Transcript_6530/g.7509  ORF Transcript_6530/g.7509 Transcript_6530/m.7509 type:complete len:201 (-) Transcript_6530:230-832(-)